MSENQSNRQNRPKGPHGMGRGPAEKAKDFKGTFKKLVGKIGAFKISVIAVIIFAIGSTIFNIVGPKILGKATTELAKGLMRMISGKG